MKRMWRPMIGLIAIVLCAFGSAATRVIADSPDSTDPVSYDGVASLGPDVIVTAITGVSNYDSETPSGSSEPIDAFSIGTIACNMGDATLVLNETSNQHAVLRQGMFRLMNGRFEQIGTSWVKHVYPGSNEPGTCGPVCANPNVAGPELRPGCTDANSAGLNGDRLNTSRSSTVNAFTGFFPHPIGTVHAVGTIAQRIQVRHSDLAPALNPGAVYFVQAHYVHPADAAAGNGENNATFARVTLHDPGTGTYTMTITSPALNRGMTKPAVLAWADSDSSVDLAFARAPGDGLFLLAAKALPAGGGFWRYEYAIENLNSDRSGGSFRVPIPQGAIVRGVGFHDVDYHSGELFSNADWVGTLLPDAVSWSTTSFSVDRNANALRWSTLYNFRFEANVGPAPTTATLGLFKPGTPSSLSIETIGPALGLIDCNGNEVLDACDVSCFMPHCVAPCGESADCNANGIPDECETDCNGNHIPDACDLAEMTSSDCDFNGVPDECDPDCDGDDIPDDCEAVRDSDADSIHDCADLCPLTTPVGACLPLDPVTCRFPTSGICLQGFPRSLCLASGGSPVCGDPGLCEGISCPDSPCRDGCLYGDYDGDGDRDLADAAAFERCFSGSLEEVGFAAPSEQCLHRFDFDLDGDIDLSDWFETVLAGMDPLR